MRLDHHDDPRNALQGEVRSPRLDAFLRSERWQPVRGEGAIRTWVRDVYREAGAGYHAADQPRREPAPLPEEHHPQRIMVMWRLARATAQLAGLAAEDETLDAATEVDPDPWTQPWRGDRSPSQAANIRRGRATKVALLRQEGDGLPLLPPPADDQAALDRWCRAAALIAKDLGIEATENGRLGLAGLIDPQHQTASDVTGEQVIRLELLLIDECQEMLREHGEPRAVKHMRETHGLSRKEAVGLVRLARADAMTTYGSTTEEDRAIMVMELKETISRAKEALDLDTEMKARKLLAMVQGLTRSEPENQAREFFQTIKRVALTQDAARQPSRLEAARTVEALPAHEPLRAHEDPHDADALAEYDRENEHIKP